MMENNKISVIMGVFNCADTLSEAIESILLQTYSDWELIMCDDCSTDDTYAVAEQYVKQYPDKMILLRNEKNKRLAYSLNHCLQYATGRYIARMDGDDISLPERFEKQVEYLKGHPKIQLVGTSMQWFDEKGKSAIDRRPEHTDRWTLHKSVPFNHPTIMTYKYVYDRLGGYTVAKRTERGQDYDLWFRFFAEGFIGDNIIEPLYLFREDGNAVKRRSFKVRWSTFETTKYGYKLLNYPFSWLVEEFFRKCLKSFTPVCLQRKYRDYIKKKNTRI